MSYKLGKILSVFVFGVMVATVFSGAMHALVQSPTTLVVEVTNEPDKLNSENRERGLTTYIELPSENDPTDIDVSTIMLNDAIKPEDHVTEIGDHDGDYIQELVVKFSSEEVEKVLQPGSNPFKISGEMITGERFEGKTSIEALGSNSPPGVSKNDPYAGVKADINALNDAIQALKDSALKKPADNRKNAFSNKLNALLNAIIEGEYEDALDKLEDDIRAKMDGYLGGNPKNDWVIDEQAQQDLNALIDIIEYADYDNDGLKLWYEVRVYGTDPFNPDTDGDGIPDDWVVRYMRTWNSVALFFNLPVGARPTDGTYRVTTVNGAREFLDEGTNPANPTISDFMRNYWDTLSYGHFVFGIDTPRDPVTNDPLIPNVDPRTFGGGPNHWGEIIDACIDANAEEVWAAAGGLTLEGKRWIPSVFLVQNYWVVASAGFGGHTRTVGGHDYEIGDVNHIRYDLTFTDFADTPASPDNTGRRIWATLSHEFAHNFFEYWDFYGPSGCTGYWDLLGDNSPPGRMSETCSFVKERLGWLTFKEVINGPTYGGFSGVDLMLRAYTTSGDAIKVVPDPVNNPHEYFLLEYRKSTGTELWRPDGALNEGGLLIIHINDRLGVPHMWMMREAPFFDVEYADFSDRGSTLWTGHDKLDGAVFPQSGGRNMFTPTSYPSSNFYGHRSSGLYISSIYTRHVSLGGRHWWECKFNLKLQGVSNVGWQPSEQDRVTVGVLSGEAKTFGGEEIFIRSNQEAALLRYSQGQWLVKSHKQTGFIECWPLEEDNYELAGDFDGDGVDEIYIRNPIWAGVLKYDEIAREFGSLNVHNIWDLISDYYGGDYTRTYSIWSHEVLDVDDDSHREFAADIDGDGCDEIIICGPEYLGFYKLGTDNRLTLQHLELDRIGGWNLGEHDRRYKGRFTQTAYDQILIVSQEYLGLIYWDDSSGFFRSGSVQYDTIDLWDLRSADKHYIGDLVGDGFSEIYIRSNFNAGVLKWDRFFRRFVCVEKYGGIVPMADRTGRISRVVFSRDDLSYVGRFLREPETARDGILHRSGTAPYPLSIITWEMGLGLRVRQQLSFPCQGGNAGPWWSLNPNYIFALGDFNRRGMDIADPRFDHIGDNITDIFAYNPSYTVDGTPFSTTIGVNFVRYGSLVTPAAIREEIGLIWIDDDRFLYKYPFI
jgi:hypothetical protein